MRWVSLFPSYYEGDTPTEMRYADVFTGEFASKDAYIAHFGGDVDFTNFSLNASEASLMVGEFSPQRGPFCAMACSNALGAIDRFSSLKTDSFRHPSILKWKLERKLK